MKKIENKKNWVTSFVIQKGRSRTERKQQNGSQDSKFEMKVLVVDIHWPIRFHMWRLCELNEMHRAFGADILSVNRVPGQPKDSDLDDKLFPWEDYRTIVFNAAYAPVNRANKSAKETACFDGNAFHGRAPKGCDLFFQHKSNSPLDLSRTTLADHIVGTYDAVVFVFLRAFHAFESIFPDLVPDTKKWIHLWPTMGTTPRACARLPMDAHFFMTQQFMVDDWRAVDPRFSERHILFAPVGQLIFRNGKRMLPPEREPRRVAHGAQICVCFTSLGKAEFKGSQNFESVVAYLVQKIGDEEEVRRRFRFVMIGVNKPTTEIAQRCIEHFPPMDPLKLFDFYFDKVDVYVNPETGMSIQGWPLGSESVLNGVALITTDVHDNNTRNGWCLKKEEITIMDFGPNLHVEIAEFLLVLAGNVDKLNQLRCNGHKAISKLVSFHQTTKLLVDAMMETEKAEEVKP